MFIGHFAVAYLLVSLFPGVPPLVPLLGVSFPDLLWPVLVLARIEKAEVNPASPRQDGIVFSSYPYSHSLLTGTAIAIVPGIVLGLVLGPVAGAVFVIGSASHWILDTVVHIRDLPVAGFGRDRMVGAGLWRSGPAAFVAELAFYGVLTVVFSPPGTAVPLLVTGVLFHLVNANSFFGFSKENPIKSVRVYAVLCLAGFAAFAFIADGIIAGGWWNF